MSPNPSFQGCVAIVTDDPGWHGKRLREALAARGYDYRYVSLTACSLNLESEGLPVLLPGFEDRLPDGVFVRGVPGGSLEQVVFYLDVLHALQHLGIPVYNDGRAVERTVDKGMTSFLLARAGIPTPPAWVLGDPEAALRIAGRELGAGHSLVSKPLFGSQGQGLRRYQSLDDLAGFAADSGIFYLQRYVHCGEQPHDFRVFVIGDRAVAAMRRCGVTWLNNVHQGARCEPVRLDNRLLCRLAEDAAKALGMGYAGIDIIRDQYGRYSVLEVNSIPAWKGLQSVSEAAIAELLVEDFLRRLAPATGLEAEAR
jgi:RimK family alpha-L-glutamate ligase